LDKPLEERDISTLNKKQIKTLKQKLKHAGKLDQLKELEDKLALLEQKEPEIETSNVEAPPKEVDVIDTRNIRVKIADFGNSCFCDRKISEEIQTRQYRSPEVIIGAKYFTAADIWSAACMAFELATGQFLFDPQAGKTYSRDEDHLALMIEMLGGPFPSELITRGSRSTKFFNTKGELLKIKKLKPTSLMQKLTEKHGFTDEGAQEFVNFLLPMLEMLPEKRATAKQMLKHPFLSSPHQ